MLSGCSSRPCPAAAAWSLLLLLLWGCCGLRRLPGRRCRCCSRCPAQGRVGPVALLLLHLSLRRPLPQLVQQRPGSPHELVGPGALQRRLLRLLPAHGEAPRSGAHGQERARSSKQEPGGRSAAPAHSGSRRIALRQKLMRSTACRDWRLFDLKGLIVCFHPAQSS